MIAKDIPRTIKDVMLKNIVVWNFKEKLMLLGGCKTTCERAYKFKKIKMYGDKGPGGHHFCYVERFAMMV